MESEKSCRVTLSQGEIEQALIDYICTHYDGLPEGVELKFPTSFLFVNKQGASMENPHHCVVTKSEVRKKETMKFGE